METSYLREFVFLADTLSFKKTAEHFYVSRSVISRHLSSMEESLGIKLVERTSHTVELTEIGRLFYHEAQIILRDYDNMIDHVRAAMESQSSIVRVGYLRNAARPVIVKFVKYMQENYSDIKLTLTCMQYGELRRAMEDGQVDIALAVNVNPKVSKHYRSTKIYTDRFSIVMSKDNPLAQRMEGLSLDELPEDKLLIPDSYVYAGLSDAVDGLVENKTRLTARATYSDVDMLYLKVQTEGYVAFSSSMNNTMFGDNVAIVPVKGADSSFSVSAFYADNLQEKEFNACQQAFEWCRTNLSGHDSDASGNVGIVLGDVER